MGTGLTGAEIAGYAAAGNGSAVVGYAMVNSANVDFMGLAFANMMLALPMYFSDEISAFINRASEFEEGEPIHTVSVPGFELDIMPIDLSRSLPMTLFLVNFGVVFVRLVSVHVL